MNTNFYSKIVKNQILLFLIGISIEISCSQKSNGRAITDISPRIIGGIPADFEHIKYQVSIRLKRRDYKFGNGHICGGALIGPRKVLTAAHCLYNADSKRYRKAHEFSVVMGTLNRFQRINGTIVSEVKSIAFMNTFSMDTMLDDVGVMFLKTGWPENKTHLTVAPIALANDVVPAGTICKVSGWGSTTGSTDRDYLSPILMVVNVSIIARDICSMSYRSLDKGMFCAGSMRGDKDSCQGDSGGPLVCNNTLVGIVSWGYGCARAFYPGVYADARYYRKWIDRQNRGSNVVWSVQSLVFTIIIANLLR